MQLRRAGSQPSGKGPSDWFTGTVRIDPSARYSSGARRRQRGDIRAGRPDGVAYPPPRPNPDRDRRRRTGSAFGRSDRGNPAGDVVWFEPGEKHWHGASPTTAMTHVAIQEALDGKSVEWMEHVTNDEYGT